MSVILVYFFYKNHKNHDQIRIRQYIFCSGKDPDLQHYTQYGTVLKNKRGGSELKVRIRAEPTILLLQIGTPP